MILTSTDQMLNVPDLMMRAKADTRVAHMLPATKIIADKVLTSLQAIPMAEVEPPAKPCRPRPDLARAKASSMSWPTGCTAP